MLYAIAREYRTGRRLYVVTTNLDAQRTAIWDMGKIASSGEPGALNLFRSILAASASVPGVFPPVLIDVESQGRRFAEMHVDGGVTTNVLIVPEAALLSGAALFAHDARPKIYIVMNGKLAPDFEVVTPSTVLIVTRSFETSVRANTRNALLASYQFAKRRNWEFNLASIDADYPEIHVDRLRPRLHAATVRIRLSKGSKRKTLAVGALGRPGVAAAARRRPVMCGRNAFHFAGAQRAIRSRVLEPS